MKQSICLIMAMVWLGLVAGPGYGQSLYLSYVEKSEEDLKQETKEMSKDIRNRFSISSVEKAQQKIDVYDYFSHFKKMLMYGGKLGTYADYETDLAFARDNELFKGLPETPDPGETVKTDFVADKYERMTTDVENEIDTYTDLVLVSLDACELLAVTSFMGIDQSDLLRHKIRAFLNTGQVYEVFAEKQAAFARTWPGLSARITAQLQMWEIQGSGPDDPIIDPKITEAITHDGDV
jgi:hypothetical protein